MKNISEKPSFLGLGDLRKRWNYTRQGINLRIKQDTEFPSPYAIINNGKTKIWLLSDIVNYENLRTNLVRRLENLSDFYSL